MPSAQIGESVLMTAVGERFANADGSSRQAELGRCREGDPVLLRREPDNPADLMAVAVYTERDVRVGYLRRAHAEWIAPIIDAGTRVTASIASVAPKGRPLSPLALTVRVTIGD